MRKFIWNNTWNEATETNNTTIYLKDSSSVEILYSGKPVHRFIETSFEVRKLMTDEYFKYKFVNDILISKNMPIMTEEEFGYMINPLSYILTSSAENLDDLQKLAGISTNIPFGNEVYMDYINRLKMTNPNMYVDGKPVTKVEIAIENNTPVAMKLFVQ